MIKNFLVILFLALLSACSSDSQEFERFIEFHTIGQGIYSGINRPIRATIRDQETWSAVWGNHMGHSVFEKQSAIDLPAVDFSKTMLFVFYLGAENNAGSFVSVDAVVEYENFIEVHIMRKQSEVPAENIATLAIMVQPYHVVQIPFSEKPVTYVFSDGVTEVKENEAVIDEFS